MHRIRPGNHRQPTPRCAPGLLHTSHHISHRNGRLQASATSNRARDPPGPSTARSPVHGLYCILLQLPLVLGTAGCKATLLSLAYVHRAFEHTQQHTLCLNHTRASKDRKALPQAHDCSASTVVRANDTAIHVINRRMARWLSVPQMFQSRLCTNIRIALTIVCAEQRQWLLCQQQPG
jgi:hypothetical protein